MDSAHFPTDLVDHEVLQSGGFAVFSSSSCEDPINIRTWVIISFKKSSCQIANNKFSGGKKKKKKKTIKADLFKWKRKNKVTNSPK